MRVRRGVNGFILPCTMHIINIKLHTIKIYINSKIYLIYTFERATKKFVVDEEVFLQKCDSFVRCITQNGVRRQEKLKLHVNHHANVYLNNAYF